MENSERFLNFVLTIDRISKNIKRINDNAMEKYNLRSAHVMCLFSLVKTGEGIYIGAAEQAVRDAYGEPTSENGSKLTYKKSDLELEFKIKDAKVSAIDFRRIR